MGGLGSLFGAGGGGLSASAGPSTSGNNDSGAIGIAVGGINTGTQTTLPPWALMAAVALVAIYLLRR